MKRLPFFPFLFNTFILTCNRSFSENKDFDVFSFSSIENQESYILNFSECRFEIAKDYSIKDSPAYNLAEFKEKKRQAILEEIAKNEKYFGLEGCKIEIFAYRLTNLPIPTNNEVPYYFVFAIKTKKGDPFFPFSMRLKIRERFQTSWENERSLEAFFENLSRKYYNIIREEISFFFHPYYLIGSPVSLYSNLQFVSSQNAMIILAVFTEFLDSLFNRFVISRKMLNLVPLTIPLDFLQGGANEYLEALEKLYEYNNLTFFPKPELFRKPGFWGLLEWYLILLLRRIMN